MGPVEGREKALFGAVRSVEPARGQRLWFACMIILWVVLAVLGAWGLVRALRSGGVEDEMPLWLFIPVLPFVLPVIFRNVLALTDDPAFIRLDAQGIHLRLPAVLTIAGLFRLTPRWDHVDIPWHEFDGCRKASGQYRDKLQIRRSRMGAAIMPVYIQWYVFNKPLQHIMAWILNYRDMLLDQAARGDGGVPAFPESDLYAKEMRLRFQVPQQICAGGLLGPFIAIFIGVAMCAGVGYGFFASGSDSVAWCILPLLVGYGTLMIGSLIFGPRLKNRRRRFLELRADGLAVGPSPARLTLYPWADVVGARLVVQIPERARASSEAGIPERIEVALRDGRMLVLQNIYDKPLKELSALLASPDVLDLRERS